LVGVALPSARSEQSPILLAGQKENAPDLPDWIKPIGQVFEWLLYPEYCKKIELEA
jgi:hypothetical protein